MLKKSRLKSQTPLNFQAFFSKINGFSSKKPLFQRFSPLFKTFFVIIFLTTVAKIGITPIFAQQAYCGANINNINTSIVYENGDVGIFDIGKYYCLQTNYDNCGKFLNEQCVSIINDEDVRATWITNYRSDYSPLDDSNDVIKMNNNSYDGVCGECKFPTQSTVSLYYCRSEADGQCSYSPLTFESLSACEAIYGHCFTECPGGPGSIIPECGGPGNDSTPDISDFYLNISVNNLKFKSLLDMNPLQNSSVFSDPDSRTPGNIINQALTAVVFPIAGVGLIILILWGGFQVLSGSLSGKQNNIDLGKKRVTAAIVGFVLLFLIYWIWRLIALATGLSVT